MLFFFLVPRSDQADQASRQICAHLFAAFFSLQSSPLLAQLFSCFQLLFPHSSHSLPVFVCQSVSQLKLFMAWWSCLTAKCRFLFAHSLQSLVHVNWFSFLSSFSFSGVIYHQRHHRPLITVDYLTAGRRVWLLLFEKNLSKGFSVVSIEDGVCDWWGTRGGRENGRWKEERKTIDI